MYIGREISTSVYGGTENEAKIKIKSVKTRKRSQPVGHCVKSVKFCCPLTGIYCF